MANHLIILWLMTSPGVWDRQELTFDSRAECIKATLILMDRTTKPRYIDLPEIYLNPRESSGIMFEEKCGTD